MLLLTLTQEMLNKGYKVENMIDSLPNHPTKKYPMRSMSGVDTFTFHHMASEAPLLNQANFHITGRYWARIGYHIVIWGNRIIQTNYLDTQSNHCSGYNHRAIGIAVLADFSKRPMTSMEKELSSVVLAALNAMLPGREIKGHKECGVKTACPVVSMDMIREGVMTLEQEMEQAEAPQKQDEIAYRMANHILYLQNMSRGKKSDGSAATPEQSKWALSQLLKMEPEFRRLGFLK